MPTVQDVSVYLIDSAVVAGVGTIVTTAMVATGVVARRRKKRLESGVPVTAVVIECDCSEDSEYRYYWYTPTVQFSTADDRRIEATPAGSTRQQEYAIGDSIDIVYDPVDPARNYVSGTGVPGGYVGTFVMAGFILSATLGFLAMFLYDKVHN